jgi:hypothetical protein
MLQDDARGGGEWLTFPGGELEGIPPTVRCAACVAAACVPAFKRASTARRGTIGTPRARTLCFQCYRAQLDRNRALRTAGNLETGSEARFQSQLPFEPVDQPRLQMLKTEQLQARNHARLGIGRFEDQRRHAQIAARHALRGIAAPDLPVRSIRPIRPITIVKTLFTTAATSACGPAGVSAIHAAELQLPESWLPFVVAR